MYSIYWIHFLTTAPFNTCLQSAKLGLWTHVLHCHSTYKQLIWHRLLATLVESATQIPPQRYLGHEGNWALLLKRMLH